MSSTAIVEKQKVTAMTVGGRGIQLTTFQEMKDFATIVVSSGLAPKEIDTPQKAFMVLQEGMEIGLSPMQSLKGIAVIHGRTYVWGDHIVAVCMASPHFDHKRYKQGFIGKPGQDGFAAFCECARIGGNVARVEFSWQQAIDSGLAGKNSNYKAHPATMLMRRATMRALRMAFADILTGVRCGEFASEGGGIDESSTTEAINTEFETVQVEPASRVPTVPIVHDDPFDAPASPQTVAEPAKPLSETASDDEVLDALDRYTKQLAKENEEPLPAACERVLRFRYTKKGDTEPTEEKVSNVAWFTAERSEAKRALRMKIARGIAMDIEATADPRFTIGEKAAA